MASSSQVAGAVPGAEILAAVFVAAIDREEGMGKLGI
jgi:hypothetical protein